MARPRELKNAKTISIIVDAEVYDKFIQNLPRHKGVSEAIRNLIEAQVEEEEKIKNLNALDQSAIKQINNKLSNDFNLSEIEKQQKTLDVFFRNFTDMELKQMLIEVDDYGLNSKLSRFGNDCVKITKVNFTKLKRNGR